jgi:hypothetical protein
MAGPYYEIAGMVRECIAFVKPPVYTLIVDFWPVTLAA